MLLFPKSNLLYLLYICIVDTVAQYSNKGGRKSGGIMTMIIFLWEVLPGFAGAIQRVGYVLINLLQN